MSGCPYCHGEDGCDFVGSSRPHDMNALTVADWGELYDFLCRVYLPFVHKLLARVQARGPVTVPPGLRPEVRAFAAAMERRLRMNEHKGGWKDCDPHWLWARVRSELEEARTAFRHRLTTGAAPVLEESADVANFLMMTCDVLGLLPGKMEGKDGKEAQT